MYGFLLRPKWVVFHIVVFSGIVVMVNLGLWQLDRLNERRAFNEQVVERTEQPPIDVVELLEPGAYDPDRDEWTSVRLTGTYLPEQIVEFNQSQAGRAGENVLTALAFDGRDDLVIVNRGFVPLPTPAPNPPRTRVEVVGVVRASEVRGRGSLTDPDVGPPTEVRRIDLDQLVGSYGEGLAPFYVQLTTQDPPVGVGDPEPIVKPDLDDGPHLSYAGQWFTFSMCVAIGWILAVRRSIGLWRRTLSVRESVETRLGDGERAATSG